MSGVMRYQRVSQDGLLLGNGKKPSVKNNHRDDVKPREDLHFPRCPNPSSSKSVKPEANNGCGHSRSGDIVLQWGHNKRSRGPRNETRALSDDPSSSSSQPRPPPPPPPSKSLRRPPAASPSARAAPVLRSCSSTRPSPESSRGEERMGTRSPSKGGKMTTPVNGMGSVAASEREAEAAPPPKERLNLDLFEWPRIYLSLSRKEKEDDFMAMKGTKLPQRPKKRAKNVDKTLQYVFPGLWLSDLSRGRYEVREKKSAKKKRRGLKGMECVDSDSD